MINFSLGKEIYGANPWFVDQQTLPSLLGILNVLQSGTTLEAPDIKYNSCEIISQETTKLIRRPYQLDNKDTFSGVGLININGPITVSGGASSFGMKQQAAMMLVMSKDERIKGFIILADSGGGSTAAIEIMTDAINEVKQTKKVIGLVDKGGVAASACFAILSACDEIFAESKMSIIGGAGTIIQFSGRKANSTDKDGVKHIRLLATKSTEKNKAFEEALNNDNFELLFSELLDPINERLLEIIENNRPQLKGSNFDNGHIVFAKDGIGTFIDGIKTFSEVFAIAAKGSINSFNLNPNKMTISEFKSEHPETYASIFKAGVTAERDRAGAWMAHSETDLPAVKVGIESGKEISATKREEFIVKAASLSHIKNLNTESAKKLKEVEEEEEEVEEVDAFYKKVDSTLNPNKAKKDVK